MQLEKLIESLALGELGTSKLFVDKPSIPTALYELTPRNRASMLNHINDALMAICVRLPLYWCSVPIRLVEGKTTYLLNSKHSIRNMPDGMVIPDNFVEGMPEAEYYIYDTDKFPFEDNLLTIQRVTSTDGMYNIPIGDGSYENAVYTPRPNVIELPEDMYDKQAFVTIIYLSHIPRIPIETKADADYEIDLPYPLIEAVSAFICHRVQLQPQNANNATISMSHMDRFNAICSEFLKNNITNMSSETPVTLFMKGGWV